MYFLGHHVQHHVARRHRHLDRRAGRRRDRRGGERLQAARAVDRGRPEGRLPRGAAAGAEGGRAVGLLLAAGDRGRVPAHLHAGRPGGPALQAARLHEEPRHGHRGVLAITLDPALRMLFTRMDPIRFRPALAGRGSRTRCWSGATTPRSATRSAASSFALYEPVCRLVLRHRALTLVAALVLVASTVPVYLRLGSEFMPPLNEGAFLYMPTDAARHLGHRGAARPADPGPHPAPFPEVERVFGKAGRADTPTDPGAVLDGGDDGRAEARVEWRASRWYSTGRDVRGSSPHLARPHHLEELRTRWTRAPLPRHAERLDHADQEPHRHALDRRAHADRHQGPRPGPRRDPGHRRRSSRRCSSGVPGRAASSPSAPPAATSSTSTSTASALARYGLTVEDAQTIVTVRRSAARP